MRHSHIASRRSPGPTSRLYRAPQPQYSGSPALPHRFPHRTVHRKRWPPAWLARPAVQSVKCQAQCAQMIMVSTPVWAKAIGQCLHGKSGQETDTQPRVSVTRSAMRRLLLREYFATNAASSRKQNVAVDADSQLSHQPTSAAPSNISPDAATSQYSVLLRLLVHSCGDTRVFITDSDDQQAPWVQPLSRRDRLRELPVGDPQSACSPDCRPLGSQE